jgi:Helix-turn-helix domain
VAPRSGEDAVAELAEQGELPGRKLAGEWRFAREAVVDWLAAR